MTNTNNSSGDWFKAWELGQKSFADAQQGFTTLLQKGKDATPADWASYFGQVSGASMVAFTKTKQPQDKLFDFFDPARWFAGSINEMQENLERLANVPKFADMPNFMAMGADLTAEVSEFQTASAALGTVVATAWQEAFETYQKQGLEPTDPKAADAWMKIANAALLETQGSEAFMAAQKAMIKASLKLRKRQVDVVQAWAKEMQLPIRAENDELIKMVHDLKQEVRALRGEVESLKAAQKT